ncbi:hypothetical protein [Streptomyces sp. NPDC007083]|uniref:hypothetical protein n=1 Tax=Streptomyces sp. NPDC007083 TaxID=3156913 RepID=UPI0033CA52EA
MIENARDWLRDHAGIAMVGGTGTLLAVSLLALGGSLFHDDAADAEAQADELIVKLEKDADTAEGALKSKHEKLLAELPDVDTERAGRDKATGRSVLLSLIDCSASSRDMKRTQVMLDARYKFLDQTSQALTQFVPEWMTATGADEGQDTTYALALLDIDVSGVQGLEYSYVGVARLDPVTAGETNGTRTTKSEYVVVTYRTTQDGTVLSFEANRVSSRSRNALLAADGESAGSSTAASPAPSPTHTEN